MPALDAAQAYFDGWNARDGAAIVASMSAGGSYADPATDGPITGAAIAAYAEALWAAFPDLSFELALISEIGGGSVAAQWIMRGTNHGSFRGLPPTGKAIELPGADFLTTDGGKVTSVVGYFDGGAVPRQLGLQVIVQPTEIGPFKFGTSVSVQTGKTEAPGVFSVTQLHAIDQDGANQVREGSRQSLTEMLGMPGFIGAVTATVGSRMVTMTAWTDAEAPRQLMREGAHAAAMKPFFAGEVASSGFTSVWSPVRINPHWVRCDACGKMQDPARAENTCKCGRHCRTGRLIGRRMRGAAMTLVLNSARLTLRPLAEDDVDLTIALLTDPVAMTYWGPTLTDGEAAAKHRNLTKRGGDGGIGMWCVEDREDGAKLGWTLLLPITDAGNSTDWDTVIEGVWPQEEVEVGYMLRPAAWGRGLATEACARMVRFAFEATPLTELVAVTHPDNTASQNVLGKCGLAGEGRRRAYDTQAPAFRITRKQWVRRQG